MSSALLKIFPRSYTLSLVLNIVFLTLMIVYIFKYNKEVNKPPVPKDVNPAWRYGNDAGVVILSGNDALNRYWVQRSTSGTNSLTFPTAEDSITSADEAFRIVGQKFYMVINNQGSKTLNFTANTGNSPSLSALSNNNYVVIEMTFTNVDEGSYAVTYADLGRGANT
jgi:hypothetical protein